jgi:malate dehydrogenase
MKISVIGAGNIGSIAALRILQEGLGEVVLIDKVPGLAEGKSLDLQDAQPLLKYNYKITGSADIAQIKDSDIVVVTAGLPRKPGMTREDLIHKNAEIIKEVSASLKKFSPRAVVVVVTNPLDLMTYLVLKLTAFNPQKVFGMGPTLDAARFAHLIAQELNIPDTDVEATVIASHGEGMLPLPRLTKIKGVALDEFLNEQKQKALVQKTVNRGAEIVSLLGSGSAYFAPTAAIVQIVRAIAKDEKRALAVSAYLGGEYGVKDLCVGVPCRLGRAGIEQVIELELNKEEKQAFLASAESIRKNLAVLKPYGV